MKIEDHRQSSKWVPAEQILNDIIPQLDSKVLVGIRKIVLLDKDYHGGPEAAGRYCPVQGTRSADIELYLDHFSRFPDQLKNDYDYQRFCLASTFCHELYHHSVRGRRIIRRPKKKAEEAKASAWSDNTLNGLFKKWYTEEDYGRLRDKINKVVADVNGTKV